MVNRILVGAGTLVGLAMGFAPGAVPMDGLLMVLVGIVNFVMNVDAEDPTVALVMAIAVGGMTASDVLHHIPALGMQIDGAFEATRHRAVGRRGDGRRDPDLQPRQGLTCRSGATCGSSLDGAGCWTPMPVGPAPASAPGGGAARAWVRP